jgi:hypothetical protein
MRTFIYLLSILPSFVFASTPADWKVMDSFGVEEAYQHKTAPTSIVTVVKKDDFDDFNLQNFNLETYIKALPETKSFIHKLVGISEWKITGFEKKEFLRGPNRIILVKFKGTYLRKEKDVIEFEEWHHFYETTFLQLQLIRNKGNTSNDDVAFFNHLQDKWL